LLCIKFGLFKSIKRIKIEKSKANTPPNLFGIDRKIAYANKKYHSGWICIGVTIGFAGKKLSGSIIRKGFKKHNIINNIKINIDLVISFIVK